MREPQPCARCQRHTFRTFGAQPYCLPCINQAKAVIRARLARREPALAPGVLRCDRCGAIREDGGPNDWFELCVHGAHEKEGTDEWRCNGRMRRMTVTQLERLMAQPSDAA